MHDYDLGQLKQAVGRVLGSNDPETHEGTAFLFRKEGNEQYWFTCHHVIMQLPEIWIAVDQHGKWETLQASYESRRSNPRKDIAVLRTTSSALVGLQPLNMGNAYAGCQKIPGDETVVVYGFAKDRKSRVMEGLPYYSYFTDAGERCFLLRKPGSPEIIASGAELTQKWNESVEMTDEVRTYTLSDGLHFAGGLSGSPVCYGAEEGGLVCLGMFAQIWFDRTGQPQEGVAIKFQELSATAGTLIPFYAYADFLLVAVTATSTEMTQASACRTTAESEPEWKQDTVQTDYYGDTREHWRPFGLPPGKQIAELLAEARIGGLVQFGSGYFEHAPDQLKAVLRDFRSTTFLLDPCSISLECLHDLLVGADICATDRFSHYWSLFCGQRQDSRRLSEAAHTAVLGQLPQVQGLCPENFRRIEDIKTFHEHLHSYFGADSDSHRSLPILSLRKSKIERIRGRITSYATRIPVAGDYSKS